MQPEKKQPTHEVFVVSGEGKEAFWTKVGAAWENRDGLGYNIQLSALPLDGRLTMRFNKPKEDDKADDSRKSEYRTQSEGR